MDRPTDHDEFRVIVSKECSCGRAITLERIVRPSEEYEYICECGVVYRLRCSPVYQNEGRPPFVYAELKAL